MNLSNFLEDLLKGRVSKGFISTNLPCGGRFRSNTLGVLEFTPTTISDDSKAFVYSCGIHGNETAPIEIMNDLVRDIYEGNIKIKNPLMIIFGHLEAMKSGTRFLKDNLNRMFSDHYKNYPNNNIETVFLMSDVKNQIISSRLIKEIAELNGDIKKFTTKSTIKSLKKKYE